MTRYKVTELNLTQDQIISKVKRYGEFTLSWHYRVDKTRATCIQMCQAKILHRSRHSKGLDIFIFHKNFLIQ